MITFIFKSKKHKWTTKERYRDALEFQDSVFQFWDHTNSGPTLTIFLVNWFIFFSEYFLFMSNRKMILRLLLPFHLLFCLVALVQSLSPAPPVHLPHPPELVRLLCVTPLSQLVLHMKAHLLFLQSIKRHFLHFWVFPQSCQVRIQHHFAQFMQNSKCWSVHPNRYWISGQTKSGLTILRNLALKKTGFLFLLLPQPYPNPVLGPFSPMPGCSSGTHSF